MLLTADGTACAETGLCEDHDNSAMRDRVERRVVRDLHSESDRPVIGSWTDCGQNPEASCYVCGTNGSDPRSQL